ncbi:phosphodiesterase [Microbacterium terricola]|uniref:3',5'-cyclic adenosine monophosphate phosphodiesterase CpdA n=1 Tax=Microbacterium terricola TaxID=344163 RepID=A0ABM8E008_9MICO|nr:phosphodiesterase [Microbacterium terricola]UYK41106.1 phosphodiesterase [Microbacterium terricola]BDV31132.1 3',5'-cyclic adenosine monophosphate phosphodiesterase CpdA [Microbacterium terricola]
MRSAEYTAPERVLVHLSDTHLRAAGSKLYDEIDAAERLGRVLASIEASGLRPHAVVVTGDLADYGEPAAYLQLRALVEPFAARLGTRVLWVMGNHDDRAAFRTVLHGDEAASLAPVDRVDELDGLRLVTLDTTVPGHHHGELRDEQLRWLRDVLATPAPLGTILAMHHPPVPSVLPLAATVELRDQARLSGVLRGSDVRAIIAGHLHYSTFATFAGIPVSVASATCYTQDLTVPVGGTRPQDGAQGYNLVHVYDDTVVHSVVPVAAAPHPLEYVDAAEALRRLAEAGIGPAAVSGPRRSAPPTQPLPVLR